MPRKQKEKNLQISKKSETLTLTLEMEEKNTYNQRANSAIFIDEKRNPNSVWNDKTTHIE